MRQIIRCGTGILSRLPNKPSHPIGAAGITTPGRLKVGDSVEVSRIISDADVLAFASLTGDRNEIHMKGDKSVVHGALLTALVSGVIGTRLPGHGTLLLEQTSRYPQPCYVNEEVRIRVDLTSVRKVVTVSYDVQVPSEKKTVLSGSARLIAPSM